MRETESLSDINVRRSMTGEEMLRVFDREVVHVGGRNDIIERLNAYYNGDEQGLRELNMIMKNKSCANL